MSFPPHPSSSSLSIISYKSNIWLTNTWKNGPWEQNGSQAMCETLQGVGLSPDIVRCDGISSLSAGSQIIVGFEVDEHEKLWHMNFTQ